MANAMNNPFCRRSDTASNQLKGQIPDYHSIDDRYLYIFVSVDIWGGGGGGWEGTHISKGVSINLDFRRGGAHLSIIEDCRYNYYITISSKNVV